MVVLRSNVIAGNRVLFAPAAKHRLNLSPVTAAFKPMFRLDPSRVGQLRRALTRLAQPGRQWVSFAFLTKDAFFEWRMDINVASFDTFASPVELGAHNLFEFSRPPPAVFGR